MRSKLDAELTEDRMASRDNTNTIIRFPVEHGIKSRQKCSILVRTYEVKALYTRMPTRQKSIPPKPMIKHYDLVSIASKNGPDETREAFRLAAMNATRRSCKTREHFRIQLSRSFCNCVSAPFLESCYCCMPCTS